LPFSFSSRINENYKNISKDKLSESQSFSIPRPCFYGLR
jgi:hypothetical protein